VAGEAKVSDGAQVRSWGGGGRWGGERARAGRKGADVKAWAHLDDRPQVAQRLELVGADLATFELDGYSLRNGACTSGCGSRVDFATGAQRMPRAQGVCVPRPRSSS